MAQEAPGDLSGRVSCPAQDIEFAFQKCFWNCSVGWFYIQYYSHGNAVAFQVSCQCPSSFILCPSFLPSFSSSLSLHLLYPFLFFLSSSLSLPPLAYSPLSFTWPGIWSPPYLISWDRFCLFDVHSSEKGIYDHGVSSERCDLTHLTGVSWFSCLAWGPFYSGTL